MNTRLSVLFSFLLFGGASLWAVDPRPRVDVDGIKARVDLEMVDKPSGGVAGNAEWAGDNKPYYLVTQGPPIEGSDWTDYTFSFMPKKSGDILIRWAGYFYRPDGDMKNVQIWTCYDNVEITGAIVENGDFEQENAEGMPEGWILYDKVQYIRENGNKYVKAWHNQPAICVLRVTAGEKVTVKVKVKRFDD